MNPLWLAHMQPSSVILRITCAIRVILIFFYVFSKDDFQLSAARNLCHVAFTVCLLTEFPKLPIITLMFPFHELEKSLKFVL
jgi:hypothetical protein